MYMHQCFKTCNAAVVKTRVTARFAVGPLLPRAGVPKPKVSSLFAYGRRGPSSLGLESCGRGVSGRRARDRPREAS